MVQKKKYDGLQIDVLLFEDIVVTSPWNTFEDFDDNNLEWDVFN